MKLRLVLSLSCCIWLASAAASQERSPATDHWSLRPRAKPTPSTFAAAADRAWIRSPIDAFILAKLADKQLRPAAEAERRVLIRRLSFDLTGLPPTPEQVEAFVHDTAPDAYERLVERLLASPQYGGHWGRHWLDVVRFAETEGFEYDRIIPGAWRYRDYVIRSFQEDKPYDRFVIEQLAGDEIDRAHPDAQIAAGFLRLSPVRRNAGNVELTFSRNEILTERTDVIGAVFMALTIGCARCHDHKFDDIPQADYYRLQAFLAAAHDEDIVQAPPNVEADWKAQTAKIEKEIAVIERKLKTLDGPARDAMEARLREAVGKKPAPLPAISTVRNLEANRTVIHVLKRGDDSKKGKRVGPRGPGLLLGHDAAELPHDTQQPRRQLAAWLTQPSHPLTARVIVNRVWQFHFGIGLVATPNDFGVNGALPSHPELLDYLANQFVAGGWRLKPLHRLIVNSSAYRQSGRSADVAMGIARDPDNRLLWRFPRRRLAAEELRDAMLSVAGLLSYKAGGPSVVLPVDRDLVGLLYVPKQWTVTPQFDEHVRRSVYLLAKRNLRLPFTDVFDQPDAQTSCARRECSTHAPQALELLNGKTSNQLAKTLAARLSAEAGSDASKQIELGFTLIAGRSPNSVERERMQAFLAEHSLGELTLALFNLNAFLYVE